MVEIKVNGENKQFDQSITVANLVAQMGFTNKRIAVERNEEIVPKGMHENTMIEDGDVLEIVQAIGGG